MAEMYVKRTYVCDRCHVIEHARFMQIPSVGSVYVCRVVVVVCFYCSRISGEVSDQTFNTLRF